MSITHSAGTHPNFDDLLDEAQKELGVSVGDDKPLDLDPEPKPPFEPEPVRDNAEYTVWYGTNRKPTEKDGSFTGFSTQRDNNIYYGKCTVFVPKGHKVGSSGSSWWKRITSGIDDRLVLRRIDPLTSDGFWDDFKTSLDKNEGRNAVVFIHGYNVSFSEAALSAAQLGFDLSLNGGMAFFSWPSQGRAMGYTADGSAIDASEADIVSFLLGFLEKSGADKVHIIAHSMGNRGLLRAIVSIAQKADILTKGKFGQVILAAPDVDLRLFEDNCASYILSCSQTTLYVSSRDLAVRSSEFINKFSRVGYAPPICIFDNIDTINVSNLSVDFIGHGYVASARPVLNDVFALIRSGFPPIKRHLHKRTTSDGKVYWEIPA